MTLEEWRYDCAVKQKKGLHFIIASVIIWTAVLIVHLTSLPILTKNLLTFCFTAPLMPIAYFISRMINVDFTNKGNPLTNLGVLFSLNQLLYLLIAMWVYPTVPESMVMVLAMIFGAHLLPFGWLYQSRNYIVLSVVIPIVSLYIGVNFPPYMVAGAMIMFEVLFSLLLSLEVKRLSSVND
ncbi:DUF7010 family protein [Niallia endozanthoxylica]|uniref:Uncharacterized protein n=1 Tax=Niallia endozanthoxylica TaxID=2036016 RepID=A0A5J5HQY9_9BACI|nr:hypothetical protein [Niallia endozanthoxylica]KAA9021994.1 hypothetical protein F4V44_15810 [Niallia endozanthoxylica]